MSSVCITQLATERFIVSTGGGNQTFNCLYKFVFSTSTPHTSISNKASKLT